MNGYAHASYAAALTQFGRPRLLPRCRGWILEREIPGSSFRDGMGCYPLFSCEDWSQLALDVASLAGDLVSLALVADPFGAYAPEQLARAFDRVVPFKEHFVVDLSVSPHAFVCAHHRRNVRQAWQRGVSVDECADPITFLDEWLRLYANLIERHRIGGIRAFSREAFAAQLGVPGIVVLRAAVDTTTVGGTMWYVDRDVAYYHLGAWSFLGYQLRASFALFWHAIDTFAAKGLRWLDLGAGAGLTARAGDGLTRFKRGWATGTRTAYFCTRIFDRETYDGLARARGISETAYFPAYRQGEFT
jgi:hypothetical protein